MRNVLGPHADRGEGDDLFAQMLANFDFNNEGWRSQRMFRVSKLSPNVLGLFWKNIFTE